MSDLADLTDMTQVKSKDFYHDFHEFYFKNQSCLPVTKFSKQMKNFLKKFHFENEIATTYYQPEK